MEDQIVNIENEDEIQMNKEHVEGSHRTAMGQGEKVVGQAMNDPRTTAQGICDDAAGKARSALGSAEDAVSRSADAVSALDFPPCAKKSLS